MTRTLLEVYTEYVRNQPEREFTGYLFDAIKAGVEPFDPKTVDIYYKDTDFFKDPETVTVHVDFRNYPEMNRVVRFDKRDLDPYEWQHSPVVYKELDRIFKELRYRPLVEREPNIELGEN